MIFEPLYQEFEGQADLALANAITREVPNYREHPLFYVLRSDVAISVLDLMITYAPGMK